MSGKQATASSTCECYLRPVDVVTEERYELLHCWPVMAATMTVYFSGEMLRRRHCWFRRQLG